jgi:hypothetical protein
MTKIAITAWHGLQNAEAYSAMRYGFYLLQCAAATEKLSHPQCDPVCREGLLATIVVDREETA